MKILSLRKNIINIQKCLVPDSNFLQKFYGRHCLVPIPGTCLMVLVKIGLSEPKQITGGFFLDDSVLVFQTSDRTRTSIVLKDVELENFQILSSVIGAKTANVRLVFGNIKLLVKPNCVEDTAREIIKNILKLYSFTRHSAIYLDNLPQRQKNGVYCIEIIDVNGCSNKDNAVFSCTEGTEINVIECISREKYETCYFHKEEIKLGGLSNTYKILKEIIEFSKNIPEKPTKVNICNKVILTGPSGCGKTALIHSLVKDCGSVMIEVLLPEICAMLPGETEDKLQDIFNRAKIHAANGENCVILIEDIDVLCTRTNKDESGVLRRIVNTMVKLLEDVDDVYNIVVIATTKYIESIDPQLRRAKRFDDDLEIMMPTEEDREEIITNILEYMKVKCPKEVIRNFVLWTPGYVGADLCMVIQESILAHYKIKGTYEEFDYEILENSFKKALSNITPSALRGSVGLQMKKDVSFSQLGGLSEIKKMLDLSVKQQLLNPEVFRRMGIPLTKGILLYGPPGCAKTSLVKALAKESNMTFLAVSSADLYSPFVGDSEKMIVRLFNQARLGAPAIIFIDEIDGLVGSKSGDRTHGVQERVLSTLLVEMDGIGLRTAVQKDPSLQLLGDQETKHRSVERDRNAVIVIGATNRPEKLDDALKRPGRFDKMVYVPPPDEEERLNILKTLTEKMPLNNDVDLKLLASKTNYYSGADLKNLCYESALLALTESEMAATHLNQSHFLKVLENGRPSLNPEMISFYESYHRNLS